MKRKDEETVGKRWQKMKMVEKMIKLDDEDKQTNGQFKKKN